MNTFATPRAGTRTKIAAVTAGCLLGALSVGAATVYDMPSVVVKYDRQSLATEMGARALYQRLVDAARIVCPAKEFPFSLHTAAVIDSCRQETVARAVHQIDNPRLAAIYASSWKSG
jgi:UrcA family protein